MEAYVLFARGKPEEVISRFEEQDEDIGCPSESSAARSTPSSSDGVDLNDDASSSGSNSRFEMASLITHLPIKRGLSKFFDGKSQSFASLAAVGALEDLPKPPAKRLKTSRSCGVGLKDAHRGSKSSTGKKQASRARLTTPTVLAGSGPRRLVRARTLVTARPAAAGKPLLFA